MGFQLRKILQFPAPFLQLTFLQTCVETQFLPQNFCAVVKLCISDVAKDKGQHVLVSRRKLFINYL